MATVQTVQTVHSLLDNVPRVIDNFSINVDEVAATGTLKVTLYVSFDCDCDDELGDVFQAVIDVLCCQIVQDSDVYNSATLELLYPGAVGEDDMYEPGERATMVYEKMNRCIDVKVFKQESSKPVSYVYEC